MAYFLFLLLMSTSLQVSVEKEILEKGADLEKAGRYEEALEEWGAAFTELEIPSLSIAREFIRVTTEQGLRNYYENASAIYQWGLSAEAIEPNRAALKREIAELSPLTDRRTYRKWQTLLEEDSPDLYRELRLFWQNINPTPSTRYNERLLEHWERIAYARSHFNRDERPPYGTDERGSVYVQYGPPARISDGALEASRGKISGVICSFTGICEDDALTDVIFDLHTRPRYEVWVYEPVYSEEVNDNLIIIFGERPQGRFGRVDVVEDFIQPRAFSRASRFFSQSDRFDEVPGENSEGADEYMSPGMVLQWIYYEQLSRTDLYFARRFTQLSMEYDALQAGHSNGTPGGAGQGRWQRQLSHSAAWENRRHAPAEMSTYKNALSSIPVNVYKYRLLDKQNRPMTAFFVESEPRQTVLVDLFLNEDIVFEADSVTEAEIVSGYELLHGLQVHALGEESLTSVQPADIVIDGDNSRPSYSVFTISHIETPHDIHLYAELHNHHPDTKPPFDSPFASTLRGMGRVETEMPEPLSSGSSLLMADLVLGYRMDRDDDAEVLFPFIVANNREIPAGEELAIHLEIYNLKQNELGFATFTIDYEIIPVRRFEWLRGTVHEVSLSLDQEVMGSRFTEDLEILTRELEPGSYRLLIAVTDIIAGEEIGEEIEFRIVERD